MKKVLCILLAMMFALTITGCGVEIADENGADDYSLATITEQNIIDMDLGASSYSNSPASDDDAYMVEPTTVKGKEFSGVAEIYGTNLLGQSDITVDLNNISVKSGNFSLVVVLDDEIVHEFDNEEMMQTFTLEDVNGYVSLRMAGETANFKINVEMW